MLIFYFLCVVVTEFVFVLFILPPPLTDRKCWDILLFDMELLFCLIMSSVFMHSEQRSITLWTQFNNTIQGCRQVKPNILLRHGRPTRLPTDMATFYVNWVKLYII